MQIRIMKIAFSRNTFDNCRLFKFLAHLGGKTLGRKHEFPHLRGIAETDISGERSKLYL